MCDIVYEDNHLIVAIKPQGVLSQADISGDADMLSILKAYIKEKYAKPGDVFLALVHRLDRPTAGLMVFARTSKAAARLSRQVREGALHKQYLLVCRGQPKGGLYEDCLLKDETANTVKVVPPGTRGGKAASLRAYPLCSESGLCLARVVLYTGRSHQIRVQFASRGTPLYGDRKYAGAKAGEELALYAWCLGFTHPTTGQSMRFTSLPQGGVWGRFGDVKGLVEASVAASAEVGE